MRRGRHIARVAGIVAAVAAAAACGKKGAPLAPLHLVPAAPTDLALRRAGAEARLSFVLPAANVGGPGPSVLDTVQIYAVTLPPGAAAPPNRDLLAPAYLVGTIAVKPPAVEGEPDAKPAPEGKSGAEGTSGAEGKTEAAADTRPSAGEKATFVEALTPEKLAGSVPVSKAAKGRGAERPAGAPLVTAALATPAAAAGTAALAAAAAAIPTLGPAGAAGAVAMSLSSAVTASIPTHAVRVYALQGVTKKGRPGPASARVELPIVPVPPTPAAVLATASEAALSVTWVAPAASAPAASAPASAAAAPAAASAPMFNVYARGGSDPLNPAPLAAPPFERPGVTWGKEECFVVRAVDKSGTVAIESDPSEPACLTPRDTFPPAAPKAVSVVAGPGVINLSWDANAEPDLAGYLVLRGEAGGGALQPLTPAPIAATNYEDRTVRPGVRYAYTIVAVDRATPPNRSAPSGRVEETAR